MGFYEQISRYYDVIFPADKSQLEFIENQAGGPPKEVLDAACGSGEYTLRLAADGYKVTAVDIDASMVEAAKAKVEAASSKAERAVISADILEADLKSIGETLSGRSFDFIFCIGNSIVHLNELDEIEASIRQMHGLLKPGGKLVLQIINFDRVLKYGISSLPTLHDDNTGLEFIRNYRWLEEKRKISFDTILTVKDNGRDVRYENSIELKPVLSEDLNDILIRAGFTGIQLYGDYSGNTYNEQSFLLIISGVKNK